MIVVHLRAYGPTMWWTRCNIRVHPNRSSTDPTEVTCRRCLDRAPR